MSKKRKTKKPTMAARIKALEDRIAVLEKQIPKTVPVPYPSIPEDPVERMRKILEEANRRVPSRPWERFNPSYPAPDYPPIVWCCR